MEYGSIWFSPQLYTKISQVAAVFKSPSWISVLCSQCRIHLAWFWEFSYF